MGENQKNIQVYEKNTVLDNITEVLDKHAEISFAYLHGSFVKGKTFRDIDVGVYLEKLPPSVLEYELKMEIELMEILGRHIVDVRVLNNAPLSFKYNVIKEGVIILEKEEDKRADFQEATLSAYFDFLPYRDVYLEETLGVKI